VPAWCRLDCRIAIYPGVHAADAAREIEQALAELPGVQSARVNLSTKRVAVESWT
jgi:copper chaperone CopZ